MPCAIMGNLRRRNEMAWKTQRGKWNWRAYLTEEEAKTVKEADEDRASIERLQKDWTRRHSLKRQMIVNRAIHRAKHAALSH